MSKKQHVKISKTTTLHVHHAFLYISLPSLHDHDVKMPYFTFYDGGRKQATTKFSFSFWTWICFLGIQLQESSPTFDKVSELELSRWRLDEREFTFYSLFKGCFRCRRRPRISRSLISSRYEDLGYVHSIPDSFSAGTKTITDGTSVHA